MSLSRPRWVGRSCAISQSCGCRRCRCCQQDRGSSSQSSNMSSGSPINSPSSSSSLSSSVITAISSSSSSIIRCFICLLDLEHAEEDGRTNLELVHHQSRHLQLEQRLRLTPGQTNKSVGVGQQARRRTPPTRKIGQSQSSS
jgi:hypothetical protein